MITRLNLQFYYKIIIIATNQYSFVVIFKVTNVNILWKPNREVEEVSLQIINCLYELQNNDVNNPNQNYD